MRICGWENDSNFFASFELGFEFFRYMLLIKSPISKTSARLKFLIFRSGRETVEKTEKLKGWMTKLS